MTNDTENRKQYVRMNRETKILFSKPKNGLWETKCEDIDSSPSQLNQEQPLKLLKVSELTDRKVRGRILLKKGNGKRITLNYIRKPDQSF